jgi:hypothetical protein
VERCSTASFWQNSGQKREKIIGSGVVVGAQARALQCAEQKKEEITQVMVFFSARFELGQSANRARYALDKTLSLCVGIEFYTENYNIAF